MGKSIRRGLVVAALTTTAAFSTVTVASADTGPKCDQGEFCAWAKESYTGKAVRFTLETANPGECVPLNGLVAHSFANRLTKEVTVYQGETCSTEADFTTYPGGGSYVPSARFVVRAIQVWQ
ncbi:peptidase inhibitor family I36 protein [Actinocrispum wychmicini]|uniref:Peptidase inhibitor family I36 n=1 Tax=Actinocrispum wychmicini TaxID=1213861 RepID=A0A4R2J2I4_9PSEU|nr:peptidase inhibitor family I36 protein [Actinocrispum wychmicini]TCO52483.1 peptidase inhibitor family I36 [Actinocrispum wychmicini]